MNESFNQNGSLSESRNRKRAIKLVEEWLKEFDNSINFIKMEKLNDELSK